MVHRFHSLDGLRAISIGCVLAAHLLPLGPFNLAVGAMGMTLFFSLSGFLITRALIENSNLFEFIVRRLTRILPAAYLYIAFVTLFVGFDRDFLLANLLFVSNYWHVGLTPLTAHFWSLCVEVQFYLAIALTVALLGKNGLALVWPTCLLITAFRFSEGTYLSILTHLRVDEILAGACVATIYSDWERNNKFAIPAFAVFGALWFVSSLPESGMFQLFRPYASAGLLACSLCLAPSLLYSILASRPMRFVAEISYALYIWHPATVYSWMSSGTLMQKYLLKRPISFALTFAAAYISTFYWERPWTRWIKERLIQLRKKQV